MSKAQMALVLASKALTLTFVVAAGAVAAVGCAGSATDLNAGSVGGAEGEEAIAVEQQAVSNCCSSGAYICPTDNIDFEYAPPFCGSLLKTTAHTRCEAHCSATCIDTGWSDDC